MTIVRAFAIAAAVLLAPAAQAEPLYLTGTIGRAPVLFMLQRDGARGLSGWYMYLKHGKEIRLTGGVDAQGHFKLTVPMNPATMSEVMEGTIDRSGHWTGTWTRPQISMSVPVVLAERHDTLAGMNGHFTCTAREVDGELGWTFTEAMNVTIARGKITALDVSHSATDIGGNEQVCGIKLGDLEPFFSPTGGLLRAKGDRPGGEGGHCSVRVVAAGDYLYLAMGDFTEDGNDCRASGDTMYCSPRGNWNDLILDRKTGKCMMVR